MAGAVNMFLPMAITLWVNYKLIQFRFDFQSLEHFDPMGFYYGALYLMLSSSLLIYCFFATMTTGSIEMNSQRVYESLWYKMPLKNRNDLRFLILFAQKEREVTGFGFIVCSLKTFLGVNIGRSERIQNFIITVLLISADAAIIVFHLSAVQGYDRFTFR